MQSAIIKSISGSVNVITEGEIRSAQIGEVIALNSVVLTSSSSECVLATSQGAIQISARQKLLLDEDVLGVSLDAVTEAQSNAGSFQHAIVQIALADPDHILSQLLADLNTLLNQSMDSVQFVDSSLLDDHTLYLEGEAEHMQPQDLLAEGLNVSQSLASELSLEEALTGEISIADATDVSESNISFDANNTATLIQILESSKNSMEVDDLIGHLVQVMDLSSHFAGSDQYFAGINAAEIGIFLDDDDLYIYNSQYDQI